MVYRTIHEGTYDEGRVKTTIYDDDEVFAEIVSKDTGLHRQCFPLWETKVSCDFESVENKDRRYEVVPTKLVVIDKVDGDLVESPLEHSQTIDAVLGNFH